MWRSAGRDHQGTMGGGRGEGGGWQTHSTDWRRTLPLPLVHERGVVFVPLLEKGPRLAPLIMRRGFGGALIASVLALCLLAQR
jgi:hypothetical protein